MLQALEREFSAPARTDPLRPVHVSIRDLTKRYGTFTALKSVSLDVYAGELKGVDEALREQGGSEELILGNGRSASVPPPI